MHAGRWAGRWRSWLSQGGTGPQWLLLAALSVTTGLYAVSLGTDTNWDLRNYHLYSGYALLSGRLQFDIAPAQLQTYFNPVANLYFYGLFRILNDWPRLLAFLMGAPAGVYAFALWKIAQLMARQALGPGLAALAAAAFATLLGMTGVAVRPSIGVSMNDVTIGALVMLSVWIAVRAVMAEGRPAAAQMLLLGLLCGAAVGLKLTNVIYVAPLGLLVLAMFGLRAAVLAASAMAVAFLVTWGPYAWMLWREFGSPVFPLYNDIFASPDYFPTRLADARFLPRDWLQAVFYPFYWLSRNESLVTELAMRDWRVAAGYVSVVAIVAVGACRRLLGESFRLSRASVLLIVLCAAAYALWAKMFGIYRYLLVVESLSGVLMIVAAHELLPANRWRAVGLAGVAMLAVLVATRVPNWGHVRHGAQVVRVDLPPVPHEAAVLLFGDDALGYLVPFLPREVRAIGVRNNLIRDGEEHGLARRIREALTAHRGPIFLVTDPHRDRGRIQSSLSNYGLRLEECSTIRSNLEPGGHLFCEVTRSGG